MSTDDGVTLHMFIRPGTPNGAAGAVVSQLAELFEFGLIGPGSAVWANLELPNALWVLSDRSSFLRIVDVPTAGWVRLTTNSASWGNVAMGITKTPGFVFSTNDMPIPAQEHDTVTVAFRNTDATRMRGFYGGNTHEMEDFEITYRAVRAVDFKIGGFQQKAPPQPPNDFDRHHAAIRGLDLMAATTGPAVHRVIRENLDAFTTTVDVEEFDRIRVVQQRMAQIAEGISDPIVHRIAGLDGIGPYRGYLDDDAAAAPGA